VPGEERLFELIEQPDLDEPVLIIGLEGWIDAGMAAAGTMEHLAATTSDPVVVASFDTDLLIDHRARRPVMHLDSGHNTGLTWPSIELRATTDTAGADVLLLAGAEPDIRWKGFARAVADLATAFGVRLVVDLGGYPAPAAHTRPIGVVATASTAELAAQVGFLPGLIDVPAGIGAAIERSSAHVGLPATGLWAQIPHYAATIPQPAATLALLEALERVAGVHFSTADLEAASDRTISQISSLVAGNPEHEAMVRELERTHDLGPTDTLAVDGEGLVAEVEEFLRDEGG
jgi:proteasome assembly chaperone (PAC2) family protein